MTDIVYEPHPVSLERKAELRALRVKIIDARYKPADLDNDLDHLDDVIDDLDDGNVGDHDEINLGSDSGEQFSDEQLHDAIDQATGERMHHKTGRAKLVATFNELNAKQD